MRHLLTTSSLAILLMACSQQSASAWCSFQFGFNIGIGFGHGDGHGHHGRHHGPPPCPFDLCGPGYAGLGGPVGAGYINNFGYANAGYGNAGYGNAGYGYGSDHGYNTPAPAPNFVAPQPTPLTSYSMPAADYSYAPVYPASYQPLSYPAGYFPMGYGYYGYYGQ